LISWWALLLLALGYVSILFAIAYWGDKADPRHFSGPVRATIYGLTLAVYCTSWTFYGAVGSAAENGWGYLPIYLGPMMVIFFGWGMIHRIVKISKRQNLTSIADFIAARYGKARSLAVLVTIIATIGSVPYIALQLKAVVAGFDIVSNYSSAGTAQYDTAFVFAAALAGRVRYPVRHAQDRRNRTPRRHDARGRIRIRRQVVCLHSRRNVRLDAHR
jgi:Na+/proline symporter